MKLFPAVFSVAATTYTRLMFYGLLVPWKFHSLDGFEWSRLFVTPSIYHSIPLVRYYEVVAVTSPNSMHHFVSVMRMFGVEHFSRFFSLVVIVVDWLWLLVISANGRNGRSIFITMIEVAKKHLIERLYFLLKEPYLRIQVNSFYVADEVLLIY